jgi:cell division protein FtsW (lipid II flippase)
VYRADYAFIVFSNYLPPHVIQSRLFKLAALFLSINALVLTLSPVVRFRSWEVELRWSHWLGLLIWIVAAFLAHRQFTRYTPDADPYLLPIAFLLTGWGLLAIWRLEVGFGVRQAAWLTVSVGAFLIGLRSAQNLDILRRYKYIFLTSGLLLTALTLVFGSNPGGSGPRLWLGCCGIYLQPSEPLKLLLIVYLSAYFAGRIPIRTRLMPLLFPTLFLTGLALTILLIQRDLGTASIFIFLYASVVYLASGKLRLLLISLAILAFAALTGYFLVNIIRIRIDAWLDPWADPSGRSYQIIQSILAVANGGLDGRGLGMGAPGLVPVAHSDFIFTSIGEEFGLLGTIGLFTLLAILVTRGFIIAIRAGSNFRRLLAAGITTYFGAQSILIIGGNLRLLPLTGVTLPFVSYGGSSLLTSFLALLILTQISNELEEEPAALLQPAPYLHIAGLLCLGIAACAIANGWWATWRADDLLIRTDNPRRAITDRYVQRGNILDRQNQALTATEGEIGGFSRRYLVPELSPVVGYTHPVYGQAGLEQTLDPYLRGLQGLPTLEIWWQHLLYGQPPRGLNVRLSLDLGIQRVADRLLGDKTGAVVLINAQTGEILAMASHPTYDANQLDKIGADLSNAPGAPLLNRATQGLYPSANIVTPLLMAKYGRSSVSDQERISLYRDLGFYHTPELRLPVSAASAAGATDVRLSPVQMAVAAAALSNGGICPTPQMVMAVDTPLQGWIVLPPDGLAAPCLPQANLQELLKGDSGPFWTYTGDSREKSAKSVTWLIGGTRPGWQGTPLGLVIILEENNPSLANAIGTGVLNEAIK